MKFSLSYILFFACYAVVDAVKAYLPFLRAFIMLACVVVGAFTIISLAVDVVQAVGS